MGAERPANPGVPIPEKVLAFQMHAGCALNPLIAHAAEGKQDILSAVPPVQYAPIGHINCAPPLQ